MKELIVKTITSTLLIILAVILMAVSILIIFFPGTLSDFNKKYGSKSLATTFKIMEYNRSKDINNLAEIVELSIVNKNDKKIIKFTEKLTKDSKFNEYKAFRDNNNSSGLLSKYDQFIFGNYIAALYRQNKKQAALDFVSVAFDNEYSLNNSTSYLVREILILKDKESGEKLLIILQQKHNDLYEGGNISDENILIAEKIEIDIKMLEKMLN